MRNRMTYLDGERAREILYQWVNLTDPRGADSIVAKSLMNLLAPRFPEFFRDAVGVELFGDELRWIYGVREHLRAAWDAADSDQRDWFIHEVRRLYSVKVNERMAKRLGAAMPAIRKKLGASIDPTQFEDELGAVAAAMAARLRQSGIWLQEYPTETPFDLLMRYLRHHSREALHCKNPGCLAPYFFKEEGKRTQTYCSDVCSREARLASKSRWWNEVGKNERAKESKDQGRPRR
jgi:hypothetical protein